MAADSVGQIGLDLVVNQGDFKKQMSGIQSLAKKAGAALASAFAVKKLVDFGAQCIELGSDLAEVQNVVDVTFPRMSRQVDEFAKSAAQSFGLSETMAKRFTGTFGAMAKAFGFGEQAAYDMSTTLTGLAGDVASFYNISQDEAYTKLKSVFTGETESLKDLGVVMTQAALDQYALANGFGKTTKAMSEAEKVALRYQFVQDQLSLASGDFIRTSDSWANQVRVLKLQFDSLKATIGQGLINVLTPVIKVINTIIGKLMSLANAFKSFTELITGKKGSGGTSAAAAGMEAVAGSAADAGTAVLGAGSAAKQAAKDLKTVTTGIDELNIIKPDTDSGASDGGSSADSFDMGELDTSAVEELDSRYQALIDRMKELASLARKGFWDAFGDTSVFDSIQNSIGSIRQSLADIFTAPEVLRAANNFADSVAYNLGRVTGAAASIGATVADNLLGGISRYFEQNSQRIQDFLVSLFNIEARGTEIKGNFAESIADIFTVFRSDSAKQITADIISIFANGFMGVVELGSAFATDVLDVLTAPIAENTDRFQSAFQGLLDVVQKVTGTVADLVADTIDGILQLYAQDVHLLFESLKSGFTEIVSTVLDAFQEYILPVLQEAADKFGEFASSTLQPLIDKFLDFAGKVAGVIGTLWNGVLKPLVLWFVQSMAPVIRDVLSSAINMFSSFASAIAGIVDSVLSVLGGLIDFVKGVFTGDWSLAWEGIQEILSGAWSFMETLVTDAVDAIANVVNLAWTTISKTTSTIFSGIKTFLASTFNAILSVVSTVIRSVQTTINTTLAAIKTNWESIWNSVKTFVSGIFDGIRNTITSKMDAVRSGIGSALNQIKSTWDNIWNSVKSFTSSIFDGIWSTIKGAINNIISGVERMANGVIKGINSMINALNRLSFSIPDWVPEIGGNTFGLHIPNISSVSIPRLAEGGYVRANTPQLAMIGDNRRYGEIVAPEDKMQEMVNRAAALASREDSMNTQYLAMMVELLREIINLIENLDLTVNIDIREIKRKLADLEKRGGYKLRTT